MASKRKMKLKWQVNNSRHIGGPKFSSMTEALAYIRWCMLNGDESSMTISRLTGCEP